MDKYAYIKVMIKRLKFQNYLYKELYDLMARGIKESRWRFVFSGGSISLPRTLSQPNSVSCRGCSASLHT